MRHDDEKLFSALPSEAAEYIRLVIKKMGYRRKVRQEVQAELIAHFEDALAGCVSEEEKKEKAHKLIESFGDPAVIGILTRRAKRRCRAAWRTAIVRFFQGIGIAVIALIFYCVYLSMGRANVDVNYVARSEEITRPVVDESLNAAPLYQKAFALYVSEPNLPGKPGVNPTTRGTSRKLTLLMALHDKQSVSELDSNELRVMKKWIADNNAAVAAFKEATKKPYCWWKRQAQNNMFIAILMPELSKMRNIARLISWQARIEAAQGQTDAAFDDLLACYRAGMHCKGPRMLIEQLVGIAIQSMACNTSSIILKDGKADAAQMRRFRVELERLVAADSFIVNFEVEKFCGYDLIQRCFTDDGCGSGHFIPGTLDIEALTRLGSVGDGTADDWTLSKYTISMGMALASADRRKTLARFDRAYQYWDVLARTMPSQQPGRAQIEHELGFDGQWIVERARYVLYYVLMPAVEKLVEISYRDEVGSNAAVVIPAVLEYKMEKGKLPEDLNEVVTAGYLKAVPRDPFGKGPIVYRKTGDTFVLYSLGLNFVDDGGTVYRNKNGKAEMWSGGPRDDHTQQPCAPHARLQQEGGDAVFWPVTN